MESRETREFASEVKFIVTPQQGAEIERWAERWLLPDAHGAHYAVTSLYFDTPDSRVFRRDGSFGRAKYRIRRYGESEHVFLERKLRTSQAVVKRRSVVLIDALERLANLPEAHWFERRLQVRGLRPTWQISYQRAAREQMTNQGPIRLTLDRHLNATPNQRIAFTEAATTPLFDHREMILELKFRRKLPELFRDLTAEFGLQQQPVSKFRLAASALAEVRCA